MKLRVENFNFDAGILTVHDGKGQKDRTVPLPQSILPELKEQLERVKDIHQQDLDSEYAGTFLDNCLEKKYKNAPKELVWHLGPWCLFPLKSHVPFAKSTLRTLKKGFWVVKVYVIKSSWERWGRAVSLTP
jgi:hypothetical protein